MGKWRGISNSYVRASMDDISTSMSPGGSIDGATKVLVNAKGNGGGGDDWSQRLDPGEYRRHYNEDNGEVLVCNGNGRAATVADDLHDSATVALSGAMHGGRVFASTLETREEDDDSPTAGGGHGESNGGASSSFLSVRVLSLPNCSIDDEELSDGEELQCGLGPCAPKWMQVFASKQAFLVVFCITWVLQGMFYTYFVSVITTIEKLFQMQSKTTGIIMSATEVGQIGSSLLLTYYGGQGHRPKWIAWGMVLFAVSAFTCSLPHFFFGDQLAQSDVMRFTNVPTKPDSSRATSTLLTANFSSHAIKHHAMYQSHLYTPLKPNICVSSELLANLSAWTNATPIPPGGEVPCGQEGIDSHRLHSKISTVVLTVFFISLLGVGMGQTAVYTLGIPYIDDNVASRESPLYFAITIGVRILGPAMGFILGSLCTLLYADLNVSPQITHNDPRWVGAWWLGLVLISTLLMLASFAMFMFPKRLKPARRRGIATPTPAKSATTIQSLSDIKDVKITSPPSPRREKKKAPSLRDFPKAVKRLLKNDILMFRTASSVLHILPIAGLYTFLPKYLETQFRLAAHTANMISGIGGILVMGLGIIISGVFILRVKPNARWVAAWIAFTAIAYAFGMGVLMLIGCPMDDFVGLPTNSSRLSTFEPVCDVPCDCDRIKFNPICGRDNRTYFSACHAGCSNVTYTVEGKVLEYSDCICIRGNSSWDEAGMSPATGAHSISLGASAGYCPLHCSNFVLYMLLFSFFVFVHSTSEVGSMLLILRCVDPRDKAMALGLIQFAIGLFGNVPCPIVYGAVVDSACLVWDMACGEKGACWLYDADVFRMFYHGTTGVILLCAFFVDLIVWYKAGSINFVQEPGGSGNCPEEELNPITSDKPPHSETSV